MPEGIKKLWEKFKTFWNDLEKGQKIRIFTLLSCTCSNSNYRSTIIKS